MKKEEGDFSVIDDGATVQVNVHRVTRPGIFVVFPSGERDKAMACARALAQRDDLPTNKDITGDVPGALAAGVTQPMHLHLGQPEIGHA